MRYKQTAIGVTPGAAVVWLPVFVLLMLVAALGVGDGPSTTPASSTLVAASLFVSGIIRFRHRERTFVDAIGSGCL